MQLDFGLVSTVTLFFISPARVGIYPLPVQRDVGYIIEILPMFLCVGVCPLVMYDKDWGEP